MAQEPLARGFLKATDDGEAITSQLEADEKAHSAKRSIGLTMT